MGQLVPWMNHERDEGFPTYSSETLILFPRYAFALSRVKMRVLSKGMVSFHVTLKEPWKYINRNKNIKVLRCIQTALEPLPSRAMNETRTVAKKKFEKNPLRRLSLKFSGVSDDRL